MPLIDELQNELYSKAKAWCDELSDMAEDEGDKDFIPDISVIERDMNQHFVKWLVAMFVEDEYGGEL